MLRPSRIAVPILAAWLCVVCPRSSVAAEDFAFHHEDVMGTALELRVLADGAEAARRAEARVLGEIDRLAAIFSGYDASSEFRRWQAARSGPAVVSPELFEVLRACDRWRAASAGAFDPRVQVLTGLWKRLAAQGRTPTAEELAGARALMARPAWRLDPESRTAECLSDAPLTLDAIAKGYIIERASEVAMAEGGVHGLLLNVGGDLRACGDAPRRVGIAPARGDSETSEPSASIEVRDRAVATSGDSQRGLRINDRWYSHVFDPRSGLPADGVAGATVVAENSADADALATILNVLPPEEGVRLVESLPDVDCRIVAADGSVARSDGWHRYEKGHPALLAVAESPKPDAPTAKGDVGKSEAPAPPGAAWGGDFELLIQFEINRPEADGGRYRRPYVAVWVEDKEGFPVRNLELWVSSGGAGPFQWLPDLKRWYRVDQARRLVDKTSMIDAISRPTRPPGKYKVLWDGKDDRGRPLPVGEYTVSLEAAREHGTYQSIRKQVTLASMPFAEELKGNVEIKSASVEYRRKGPAK